MRLLFDTSGWDRQRMAKFFAVGAGGVLINLAAMSVIMAAVGWKDWRASVLASLVATLNNYLWNNFWTFRDRVHSGRQLVSGYGRFLVASTAGLIVTTAAFALLKKSSDLSVAQVGRASLLPSWSLLVFQGVAILFGAFSNYRLNGWITWKDRPPLGRLQPVGAQEQEAAVPASAGSRTR
jgi:putative flippase GtrA